MIKARKSVSEHATRKISGNIQVHNFFLIYERDEVSELSTNPTLGRDRSLQARWDVNTSLLDSWSESVGRSQLE